MNNPATESKHTPGPWRYKPHSVDSNYMLIFCSADPAEGDNLRGYCGDANARLIAAAPALLEALQDLLAEAEEGIATSPLTRAKARAALHQSTGGADHG